MSEKRQVVGRPRVKATPAAAENVDKGPHAADIERGQRNRGEEVIAGDSRIVSSGGRQIAVRRRIVIVEDNTDNRQMLLSLLQLSGHQVAAAADGRTGLEMIRATRPEIALVDISLPVLDGHEVARQLRVQPECDDVYLVALTGHARAEDRRRALEAGFDAHLAKPVDFDELNHFLAYSAHGAHPADQVRFAPNS